MIFSMIPVVWWVNLSLAACTVLTFIGALGVSLSHVSIPVATTAKIEKARLPEIKVEDRKMDQAAFSSILAMDPFVQERVFSDKPKEPEKKEPEDVKVADEKPEPLPENELTVYALVSGDGVRGAIISNPGIEGIERNQVYVKEKQQAGPFLIESILPDRMIIAKDAKRFEVMLKKPEPKLKKKPGKQPEKTPGETGTEKKEKDGKPRIVDVKASASKKSSDPRSPSSPEGEKEKKDSSPESSGKAVGTPLDNAEQVGKEDKKEEEEFEYFNTPFGKIKRKK